MAHPVCADAMLKWRCAGIEPVVKGQAVAMTDVRCACEGGVMQRFDMPCMHKLVEEGERFFIGAAAKCVGVSGERPASRI